MSRRPLARVRHLAVLLAAAFLVAACTGIGLPGDGEPQRVYQDPLAPAGQDW
jgi:hypothetical protein